MRWLSKLWELEKEISTLEKDLKQLHLESPGDPSIQALECFIEFKKQTKSDLGELVGTFRGFENKLLKLKYVDGMTLEDIAKHLGFSDSHIYKKHAEIMRTMKLKNEVS